MSIELRTSRWLLGLASAVVLLFAASSVVSEVVSGRIDDEVGQLREDTLPSLAQLGAAKSALRRIDRTATELAGPKPDRARLERDLALARKQLDTALVGYLELPSTGGERARYPEVQRRIGALDGALGDLAKAVAAASASDGALVLAADRVDVGVESVDESLEGLVELAANEATATTTRLAASRKLSGRFGLALAGACVVIASIAALLAARAARRAFGLAVEERRAKELEDFAQRVAHDLLSPLASLTYCVGTLKRKAPADEAAQRAATRALACVHRAQMLVKGIFEFARAGARPDASSHAPVASVLAGVLDDVAGEDVAGGTEEGEAPLDVEVAPFDDADVACAPGVLASMLGNLVSNAVKFTREEGTREVRVRLLDHGDTIRFEVEDNGPGLPVDFAGRAFEAYERAPGATQPGLGLGLATVRRFAEAHGGAAGYRPAPRKGAIFWFELPRHAPAEPPPRPLESSPELH
jgi:signal transduction histidine kinase